jgi:hypothetical protein
MAAAGVLLEKQQMADAGALLEKQTFFLRITNGGRWRTVRKTFIFPENYKLADTGALLEKHTLEDNKWRPLAHC